jgi:type 1 glutamine amidotransferase
MTERTALVLAGGLNHGYEQACASVVELIEASGIGCEVVEEPAEVSRLDHDLFVVGALWFTMSLDRYDAVRDEWARTLPDRARAAIEAHVAAGRPILGLHTASICFDDWPRWGELLGGAWNWDRSCHPPLSEDPVQVTVAPTGHPLTEGLDDFEIVDEVYGFLDLQPDVVALMTSPHSGADHPLLWARTLPTGSRVVYDALGHDRRSVEHPTHREILRRSVDWLVGTLS